MASTPLISEPLHQKILVLKTHSTKHCFIIDHPTTPVHLFIFLSFHPSISPQPITHHPSPCPHFLVIPTKEGPPPQRQSFHHPIHIIHNSQFIIIPILKSQISKPITHHPSPITHYPSPIAHHPSPCHPGKGGTSASAAIFLSPNPPIHITHNS